MPNENEGTASSQEILYEDGDLFVINKPAGVLSASTVHRLDRDTSGVLIFAKNDRAREFLQHQFRTRSVHKTYLALVYGRVKKDGGVIDAPIGRAPGNVRKKLAGPKAKGKLRDAVTRYAVRERLEQYTLLEVHPETGRTNQIRVHLKSIGHPVACDAVYTRGKTCPVPLARLALHAAAIEFQLPPTSAEATAGKSGARLRVEADLPEDFSSAIANLRKT